MDCSDCDQLQKTFQDIVRRNIELLAKFQTALFDRDDTRIERLRLALIEIEERRRETRIKLMAHQAVHGKKKTAAVE
jgi:hypothetical protein